MKNHTGNRYRDLIIELNIDAHDSYSRIVEVAHWRAARARFLHILAGILALLSGGTITGVATNILEPLSWQIVSAAIAFISGAATLVASLAYSEKDTHAMLELSGKFLALREEGSVLIHHPEKSDEDLFKDFKRLSAQFASIQAESDKYIPSSRKQLPARA